MLKTVSAIAATAMLCAATTGSAGNSMARHERLFAVPRPGPVVVDGKLDDWDLSGQIFIYVLEETSASQSARFAVMYDDEALYLSAVMRDSSPMMNRHDPLIEAHQSWDADACQFRLVLDAAQPYPATDTKTTKTFNDQLARLTMWYFTDRQEANLLLVHGMAMTNTRGEELRGGVPHDQFAGVYLLADDKLGYTFEYRIPWTTLKARKPPAAGDLVAGQVQFNFSRPDGMKTAGRSAWAYDVMNQPGFPYKDARCWGKLIFSAEGNLPRELVEEGSPPEKILPLTFAYDLPEEAEVSAALYDDRNMLVRNIVVQGDRLAGHVVESWDGLDELGKPISAGVYNWRGLYHQPLKTKFVLSVHNSGQPPYKTDNNRGGWGGDHGQPTDIAIAGDSVIMTWDNAESGWGLIVTDLKGRKRWGTRMCALYVATDGKRCFSGGGGGFMPHDGINVLSLRDGRPLNFANGKPELMAPDGGDKTTNRPTGVAWHDGAVYVSYRARDLIVSFDAESGDQRRAFSVPAPGRLAVAADGRLLVVSGSRLVVVDGDAVGDFATSGIDQPAAVAVGSDGHVYVSNRGASQNVAVLAADGRFLRSLGKTGGRPRRGPYDPAGVLEPLGLAADDQGGVWVAEAIDSPKRISVWDTASGELRQEFFGGSAYSTFLSIDPLRPDEAYCHNTLWTIDLDQGTWYPKSTAWRQVNELEAHETGTWGYNGHARVMTADNGQQFAWGMWNYAHVVSIRDGDLLKPFLSAIRVHRQNQRWPGLYPFIRDDPETYPDGAYLWQDANDDQMLQPSEVTPAPFSDRAGYLLNWLDHDLRLWCDAGCYFDPIRFAGTRPIYDFTKPQDSPFSAGHSNFTSLWSGQDDTIYTLFKRGGPPFAKWTRDGQLLWGVRDVPNWQTALSRPLIQPGKVWGPTMPLGEAGGFTGIATYFGPFQLFTDDGIPVGMVFRDSREGGVGADVIGCEAFSGQLVQPRGSNRYFILAGDQDGRVTEILGLDTVQRLAGGTYEVTEAMASQATEALAAYERAKAAASQLVIGRGQPGRAVGKDVDGKRGFKASVAYNASQLILAYEVRSPSPLVNAVADRSVIFKGGNLLDLQLATDAAADPERQQPAAGDLRVLVTRQGGKPIAVVYRPRVAGFSGERIVLQSPTGKESFDAIDVLENITLNVKPGNEGFSATVTLPLKELGWQPQPGQSVKMDLGYVYGNKTGTAVAYRSYWRNNSFTANVVGDVPNESRLEPHEWGSATVE